MKKLLKFFSLFASVLIFSSALYGCSKKENTGLTKVKLNEVTRSVFYAPMYAAINQGFFKEEGLDINLSVGNGSDKTMQEVLSGSADIGFGGPEQVIYIYNQKRADYPVVFSLLTQRDGSFLVGRNKIDNFNWSDLKGKTVVGGRPGGVPEMAFEYVLKANGINPKKDLNIITNIAFAAVPGALTRYIKLR
ncbi:ABC transporter substrate-binding protein [Clostridium sp. 19966]|nr:ABC transporter substrate-binding protein [Clostridium sp. 19966]